VRDKLKFLVIILYKILLAVLDVFHRFGQQCKEREREVGEGRGLGVLLIQ
jgi:hypothetical protein